jgi:hypothetical protein
VAARRCWRCERRLPKRTRAEEDAAPGTRRERARVERHGQYILATTRVHSQRGRAGIGHRTHQGGNVRRQFTQSHTSQAGEWYAVEYPNSRNCGLICSQSLRRRHHSRCGTEAPVSHSRAPSPPLPPNRWASAAARGERLTTCRRASGGVRRPPPGVLRPHAAQLCRCRAATRTTPLLASPARVAAPGGALCSMRRARIRWHVTPERFPRTSAARRAPRYKDKMMT